MADKKISQLSSASTPLSGTEVLPIVQSSTTVKVSVADLTAGRAVAASTLTVSGDAAVGATAPLNATTGRIYLAIKGTGTAAGTGNGVVQFQTNAAGSTSPNVGNIEWNLPDNTVSVSTRVAFINSSVVGATDGNRGAYMAFATKTDNVSGAATERMRLDSLGNVIAGGSIALATTATDGFLYVPTCAGTPIGTPTTVTGMAPIVVDTTNNKLYFYSSGVWRDAGP